MGTKKKPHRRTGTRAQMALSRMRMGSLRDLVLTLTPFLTLTLNGQIWPILSEYLSTTFDVILRRDFSQTERFFCFVSRLWAHTSHRCEQNCIFVRLWINSCYYLLMRVKMSLWALSCVNSNQNESVGGVTPSGFHGVSSHPIMAFTRTTMEKDQELTCRWWKRWI